MKYKLVYLFAALLSFAACKIHVDPITTGAVFIQFISPERTATVEKKDSLEIEIKFKADTEVVDFANVKIVTLKENKEALTKLNPAEIGDLLTDNGELVLDATIEDVRESVYIFWQNINISNYKEGICFVIKANAESSNSEIAGLETLTTYFCID